MDVNNNFPDPVIHECAECKHPISISTHAQCVTVVCEKCHACYKVVNSGLIKQAGRPGESNSLFYIPLNSTGVIKDRKYKLIGAMEKYEKGTEYYWREYLLFNPYFGYAFLAEYEGHWTFLEQLIVHPKNVKIKEDLAFNRQWFRFFNKYVPRLASASGEFCFDVLDENDYNIKELISPPYMLSYEKSSDEQMWFSGEYIKASEVQSVFNIKVPPPKQNGIGACQPMKLSFRFDVLLNLTAVLIVLLISIQIFFSFAAGEKTLFNKSIDLQTDSAGNLMPVVSESFEVANGPTNISFDFHAPVSNSWMEFSVDLINDNTGEEYEFNSAIEYYYGFTDGTNWTEGSQSSNSLLSSIPSGKYHLNIWPYRESPTTATYFELKTKAGVPMYSNMFVVAGLILVFPFITYYRRNSFEKKRWMNSDYSPYDE